MNDNNFKIGFQGQAVLTEVYKNERDRRYYAVLSSQASALGIKENVMPTELTFEIQISQEIYVRLKEQLASSTAESPVLRVTGCLDLIVEGECTN